MRRFWLRALLSPRVALHWRKHAQNVFRQYGAALPDSRVLSKPLHGYLRRGLNPAARLRLLIEHYRLLSEVTAPDFLRLLCAGERIEIARLRGRKGSKFCLFLVSSSMVQTQREGECAICLQREGSETLLSRLTFSLFMENGRIALAIGGLQGPVAGHKREIIDATRELFGLRPKDATLLAARAMAEKQGLHVHAIADALHVHRPLPDDIKFCSYDNYWRERGATEGGPLGFVFPPLAVRSVPSNGRDGVKVAIIKASGSALAGESGKQR